MGLGGVRKKRKYKMKKIILAAAIVCATALAGAATVGWTHAGLNSCAGNNYYVFVVGQNGVADIATVTALLDAGEDFSSYVFGNGTIGANGFANVAASSSGKTLGAGTYTAFTVVFNSAAPTAGESQYLLVSGQPRQTQTVAATTASVQFIAGNVSTLANNAANWKDYGAAVPEPTSAMLLVLGVAALALRRKQK